MFSIQSLPHELCVAIADGLSPFDLQNLRMTSRSWAFAVSVSELFRRMDYRVPKGISLKGMRLQLDSPHAPRGVMGWDLSKNIMVSADAHGYITISDIASERVLQQFSAHDSGRTAHGCALSPDGKRVAACESGGTEVRVWEVESSKCLQIFQCEYVGWNDCKFSRDSKKLAVFAGPNEGTSVWDLESGSRLRLPFLAIRGDINSAFRLAVDVEENPPHTSTVRIIDVESGGCRHTQTFPHEIRCCKFTPDGTKIAVAATVYNPYGIYILDAESGACFQKYEAESGQNLQRAIRRLFSVASVIFSPDSERMAAPSHEGTLRVWDIKSETCIQIFHDPTVDVHSCRFSPDGRRIVFWSYDRKAIRIFDIESGKYVQKLVSNTNKIASCAFSPDGRMLVSVCEDRTVKIWTCEESWWLNRLWNRVAYSEGTPQEKRIVFIRAVIFRIQQDLSLLSYFTCQDTLSYAAHLQRQIDSLPVDEALLNSEFLQKIQDRAGIILTQAICRHEQCKRFAISKEEESQRNSIFERFDAAQI